MLNLHLLFRRYIISVITKLKNGSDKMSDTTAQIRQWLIDNSEAEYADFTSKLVPNIDRSEILGVRTPLLRKYSKQLSKTISYSDSFLFDLPHKYHEENQVHSFLIEQITDFDGTIKYVEMFLPYITNWCVCDSLSPKSFAKNTDNLLPYIKKWLLSDKTYTIRFGISMLMSFYLDNKFLPKYNMLVYSVKSEEYYVNMMIAWYLATALAKQYKNTVSILENRILDKWVHNKTIQKAIESNRISPDKKEYLKTLKIK